MYMLRDGTYTTSIHEYLESAKNFFHVDTMAAPVVSLLHSYGYLTKKSCEGHIAPYNHDKNNLYKSHHILHPYIVISNSKLLFKKNIPNTIATIHYNKCVCFNEFGFSIPEANECQPYEISNNEEFICTIKPIIDYNILDPYAFYEKNLKAWKKLYKFLSENLERNNILVEESYLQLAMI